MLTRKIIHIAVIIALLVALAPNNLTHSAEAPNVTFKVLNNTGSLLNGALVKVYQDFSRTTFADDLLALGDNDANKETSNGEALLKLAPGSYEYIVESLGYNSIYGTLDLAEESKTINLTMSKTGIGVIAPHRSSISISDSKPAGDGLGSTTLEILLRSDDNTGLNGYSVTVVSSRGSLDIFDANPKTTASGGRVQFILKSSVPGKAKLYAKAQEVRLATNALITFTGEATASSEKSTLSLSVNATEAGKLVNLNVILRSLANDVLSNREVIVTSSRSADTIAPLSATTNENGLASFGITPSSLGVSTLTVGSGNITLGTLILNVTEVAPKATTLPTGVNIGALVKSADNPAVYYVGRDHRRHAFPNEKTYFTWYSDFSTVKTVSPTDLASISLGKNVTYGPGARMIKLQTIPKVYAVARGSILRWVQTEALAKVLYGPTWNKKIDDLSDAFFINYTEGDPIDEAGDFNPTNETSLGTTIDEQLGL